MIVPLHPFPIRLSTLFFSLVPAFGGGWCSAVDLESMTHAPTINMVCGGSAMEVALNLGAFGLTRAPVDGGSERRIAKRLPNDCQTIAKTTGNHRFSGVLTGCHWSG